MEIMDRPAYANKFQPGDIALVINKNRIEYGSECTIIRYGEIGIEVKHNDGGIGYYAESELNPVNNR